MKHKDIINSISSLGFPLFDAEKKQDAGTALAGIVKSKELRLWEGFPVVLANSLERGLFTYNDINRMLKKTLEKSTFNSLIAMSLALYDFFSLKFSWSKGLQKKLPPAQKKEKEEFIRRLKKQDSFYLSGQKMSSKRVKTVFENYFSQKRNTLNELFLVKNELRLEYSLSQIFSARQKELLFKKLKREKFSKTEKEYYSRVIKKKVLALADPELHNLAQRLLSEA